LKTGLCFYCYSLYLYIENHLRDSGQEPRPLQKIQFILNTI